MFAPKFPLTPGYEVVGTVDKIGSAAPTSLKVGDKVAALITYGGMAEYCTKPAERFIKVEPPSLKDEDVVPLILNYVTAYQMIVRKAKLKAGQTGLFSSFFTNVFICCQKF